MITVDIDRSTVTIFDSSGYRRYGAVGLICPAHESQPDEPVANRVLGGPTGPGTMGLPTGWDVIIPLENGAFVHLETIDGKDAMNLTLHSSICSEYKETNYDGPPKVLWLPKMLDLAGRRLRWHDRKIAGEFTWEKAEPEWTWSFIQRVGSMPMPEVGNGPAATPIPLDALVALRGVTA